MAIIHFSLKPRAWSAGQTAQRAVQYLTREGPYAPAHAIEPAQREVGYLVRETAATQDRDDLVWQQVSNLPAWAQGSASRFFAAAATYERANGRWGRTPQWGMASTPCQTTRPVPGDRTPHNHHGYRPRMQPRAHTAAHATKPTAGTRTETSRDAMDGIDERCEK